MRSMVRARTAANVPTFQTTELPPEQDRDERIDWTLMGIDLTAIVVLGAGLVTALLGR